MQSLCVYTTASLWNIAETNVTFRDTGHESKDIEGSAPFRMKASAALNSAVNVAAALASLYIPCMITALHLAETALRQATTAANGKDCTGQWSTMIPQR